MDMRIALVPGDGIGPDIVSEAVRVLDRVASRFGHTVSYKEIDAGGISIDKYGIPLTEDALESAKQADAVLLGAVGGPKWDTLPGAKRPEKALLGLRSGLGLFCNLRPAVIYPELSSASPLSRETCSFPDTITPIDQSIVFVTEKGVMLLQSSDIIELSRDMNGRHYSAEKQVKDLLSGSRWSQFSGILSDDTAFMEFVSKSRIAYDYTGARLIFFSEEDPAYQYVYMIKTGTWHKQSIIVSGTVPVLKRVLNSYPDCYISAAGSDGRSMLLNLSTPLDVRSRDRMAGVLVSRPFDLDNPDVMKVINRLRIRGNFSDGAVKYILLGSQDGISFKILKSLRSGSYKLYRIIILTDMYPDERISWIDIDYSVRFANRLR